MSQGEHCNTTILYLLSFVVIALVIVMMKYPQLIEGVSGGVSAQLDSHRGGSIVVGRGGGARGGGGRGGGSEPLAYNEAIHATGQDFSEVQNNQQQRGGRGGRNQIGRYPQNYQQGGRGYYQQQQRGQGYYPQHNQQQDQYNAYWNNYWRNYYRQRALQNEMEIQQQQDEIQQDEIQSVIEQKEKGGFWSWLANLFK